MTVDRARFYTNLRKGKLLGPVLTKPEVAGCEAILNAIEGRGWSAHWIAYALATAYHETAFTMEPVREFGGPRYFTKMYDIKGSRPKTARKMGNVTEGDGIKYSGRGFVQLTWFVNYKRASEKLGVDLVNNPDLAMQSEIAAKIMVLGMEEGWFTGHKLADFNLHGGRYDNVGARRIINGMDEASTIAKYAEQFFKDLTT